MEKHPDDKKPVVEYTAKITLPNGEVIEKTVSTEGDFPSLEEFDLSTRDGLLRDFDLLEKTVLETSRKFNGELSREYLDASSKKKTKTKVASTSLEAESGRISIRVYGSLADSLQPKERVLSLSFLEAASCVCTKTSYWDAADILNRFPGRTDINSIKLRTLSDSIGRIGAEISEELSDVTAHILSMYGFDAESALPLEGVVLSDNITTVSVSQDAGPDKPGINEAIAAVNDSREEKIPFSAAEIKIESFPEECVYVSIDDIGVKHQKDSRKEGSVRDYKYVENTVAHIQYGDESYILTGTGMRNVFKSVPAFLLVNNLLGYFQKKGAAITCYALRAKLGLRNSSNPVEKANDLVVAGRQKHNGMAWSPEGSGALAALQMIYLNNQPDLWFHRSLRSLFL